MLDSLFELLVTEVDILIIQQNLTFTFLKDSELFLFLTILNGYFS